MANRETAIIENHLNFDQILSFPSPSPSLQSLFAVTLSSVLRESPDPAGAWLPLLDAETLTLIYILVNCLHPLVSSSFSLLKTQLLLMSVNETHLKGIAPSLSLAWVNHHWKLPAPESLKGGMCPLGCPTGVRQPRRLSPPLCLPSLKGPRAQGAKRPGCLPHLSGPLCKTLHAECAGRLGR